MSRSITDYVRLLVSLLPKGKAWNKEPDSNLAEILYGFAAELKRVEDRMEDLTTEARVTTTSELLDDHERDFGLPDQFSDTLATDAQRVDAIHAKLIATGRQNKQYFVSIASALGYDVIIVEHSPAWCGIVRCGDRCGGLQMMHYWSTVIDYSNSLCDYLQAGDAAGDSLARLPLMSNLVGLFDKYRPSQTMNLYTFYGASFSSAFGPSIDSMPGTDFAAYWSAGNFNRAFNLSFSIDRNVDLSSYFTGAFDRGFSSAFDVFYYAYS